MLCMKKLYLKSFNTRVKLVLKQRWKKWSLNRKKTRFPQRIPRRLLTCFFFFRSNGRYGWTRVVLEKSLSSMVLMVDGHDTRYCFYWDIFYRTFSHCYEALVCNQILLYQSMAKNKTKQKTIVNSVDTNDMQLLIFPSADIHFQAQPSTISFTLIK